jgi:hypothetical protein
VTSSLERGLLLAIVSLMRDREPGGMPLDGEWAELHYVKLSDVYERCYQFKPDQSYETQRRNQRQALRRALGRLHKQGWVDALALGWCQVRGAEWVEWYGGGRLERKSSDYAMRYGDKTPNWKMVSLSEGGIA